ARAGSTREGEPVCSSCYREIRPRKACSFCGQEQISVATTDAGGAVCQLCWAKHLVPLQACSICKKEKRLKRLAPDGARVCNACWTKLKAESCGRCGKTAPVHTRDAARRPICKRCYRAERRAQA